MRYITIKGELYFLVQGVQRRVKQNTTSILNIYKKDSQPMPKQTRGCCHHIW